MSSETHPWNFTQRPQDWNNLLLEQPNQRSIQRRFLLEVEGTLHPTIFVDRPQKKTHLLIRFRCFLRGIWAGWIIATQWFGRFWSNSLVPTRHWYNKGRWHEYLNFPYSFCVAGRWNPRISRFPVRCLMWNSVCLRRKYSKGIEIDCHYYILCVNVYCIYTVHIIFLSLLLSSSTIIVIITVVIITVSLSLYMPITRKP